MVIITCSGWWGREDGSEREIAVSKLGSKQEQRPAPAKQLRGGQQRSILVASATICPAGARLPAGPPIKPTDFNLIGGRSCTVIHFLPEIARSHAARDGSHVYRRSPGAPGPEPAPRGRRCREQELGMPGRCGAAPAGVSLQCQVAPPGQMRACGDTRSRKDVAPGLQCAKSTLRPRPGGVTTAGPACSRSSGRTQTAITVFSACVPAPAAQRGAVGANSAKRPAAR